MPIYEYECQDCGKTFEAFLGVKEGPVTECSHCNSPRIKKLISNCSFQLKGTGWYLTDYARKDNPGNNGSGASQNSPTDAKETGKAADSTEADGNEKSKTSKPEKKTDSGKAA